MISILGYGCSTNAGRGANALWKKLTSGEPAVQSPWKHDGRTAKEILLEELRAVYAEACETLSPEARERIHRGDRLGVILASTKGTIEDFVWKTETPDSSRDPLAPLLDAALDAFKLVPIQRVCVSNACASGLAALALAKVWIKSNRVDDVVILAADMAGPFVQKGFGCLRVLTPEKTRPFAPSRSGFHLGDAAAAMIVSRHIERDGIVIADAQIDSEGHAVSRPTHGGESLTRACTKLADLEEEPPDLVVAHGTATQPNDAIEDRVFGRLFGTQKPWVTNTKWCVGHTLGVSGLIDVIAAAKILSEQETFTIASTETVDPTFTGNYLISGSNKDIGPLRSILVTSLGFGGVHAAVHLLKGESVR